MALVVSMAVAVAVAAGLPGLLLPRRRRPVPVRLDPYLDRLQQLSRT